jgi:hypothetical protein
MRPCSGTQRTSGKLTLQHREPSSSARIVPPDESATSLVGRRRVHVRQWDTGHGGCQTAWQQTVEAVGQHDGGPDWSTPRLSQPGPSRRIGDKADSSQVCLPNCQLETELTITMADRLEYYPEPNCQKGSVHAIAPRVKAVFKQSKGDCDAGWSVQLRGTLAAVCSTRSPNASMACPSAFVPSISLSDSGFAKYLARHGEISKCMRGSCNGLTRMVEGALARRSSWAEIEDPPSLSVSRSDLRLQSVCLCRFHVCVDMEHCD